MDHRANGCGIYCAVEVNKTLLSIVRYSILAWVTAKFVVVYIQRQILHRTHWGFRTNLATDMFEWVERFCTSRRLHTSLVKLSAADFHVFSTIAESAA